MKKKLISFALIACMLFVLCACTVQTLDAPTNVKVSSNGLVTWHAVENATGYVVTVNGQQFTVTDTSYQVTDISNGFKCSVIATADGFKNSAPSEEATFTPPQKNIKVAVSGKSSVRCGNSTTFTATVTGTENKAVSWSIVEGGEYATINNSGVVTTKADINGDKRVIVRATSEEDSKFYGEKVLTINAKTELTKEMLDALNKEGNVAYSGYVNVSVYHERVFGDPILLSTTILPIQTAMDGERWYAEYDNGISKQNIYYKNVDGVAYQIGLSLTNEESYTVLTDNTNNHMSWQNSGLYNSLKNLDKSNFTFDEETWRWMYTGDNDLVDKIAASINPYDFVAKADESGKKHFYLIIDDGEINGISIQSEVDYTIQPGESTYQEVFVAVNHGDTVEIPTIQKYEYKSELHDELKAAIENQKKLTSYKLDFKELMSSPMTNNFTESGYLETVMSNICYFEPYEVKYLEGKEIHEVTPDKQFGFVKISENVYNSFNFDSDNAQFVASRAFNDVFGAARPSFNFAAEIFDTKVVDENDDTRTTYYVAEQMSQVATTFYKHVGTDIDMYGMFAQRGRLNDVTFTPYVTVQNGLIVETGFYFYMGQLYGVITIKYSDFNEASVSQEVKDGLNLDKFEARKVPSSWDEVEIIVDSSEKLGNITYTPVKEGDDKQGFYVNAAEYMKLYFHENTITERIPFFGSALGDTYGFGAISTYYSPESRMNHTALSYYFDVPLDLDYTINSSIDVVGKYLIQQGYTKNKYGEFKKDGINIAVSNNQLDLFIYVWIDKVEA